MAENSRRSRTPVRAILVLTLMTAWVALAHPAAAREPCEAGVDGPTFIDPSASVGKDVAFGDCDYVAPFAEVKGKVRVGDRSDIQDSASVRGSTVLGEEAIIAHGASAIGSAKIGRQGNCPGGAAPCPSFVGFNSLVESGIIERDAMVTHLARVGPGVRIPSGRKVLPGKNITRQSEVMAKTAPVTEADRAFMEGVIHVNTSLARVYTKLAEEDESNVYGINYDPGNTDFNAGRDLPTLAGRATRNPDFMDNGARIIGDVTMHETAKELEELLGFGVSLRADEGGPFQVGSISEMKSRTTFHALEHTRLALGDHGRYGKRSLVHGGPDPFDPTTTGANFTLGESSVFFRSSAGDDVKIGRRSFVQSSKLPSGTKVPNKTTVIGGVYDTVEW